MFRYKVKNPLCLTDLEGAYAILYGWLIFFLQKPPFLMRANNSYWLQYCLMVRRKLASLLLTSPEKSIMTATAESGGKLQSILPTEKWKLEEKDYVLLGTRKQVVVNLYLGNVLFPNISLLGTIYSNSSFQMQYSGCQDMHCSEMGPAVAEKKCYHKQATDPSCTQTFCVIYCL